DRVGRGRAIRRWRTAAAGVRARVHDHAPNAHTRGDRRIGDADGELAPRVPVDVTEARHRVTELLAVGDADVGVELRPVEAREDPHVPEARVVALVRADREVGLAVAVPIAHAGHGP